MSESLAIIGYVGIMSVTPGPNNIMLATSGVNFGLRRTLPHLLGVSLGNGLLIFICALLLSLVSQWVETLRPWLAMAGCAYLLYLSARLLWASLPGQSNVARPIGFLGAALFQWVNPKAWVMVLNAAVLFLPEGAGVMDALLLALTAIAISLPCISLWAILGDRLRQWLGQSSRLRLFNFTMAALLSITALWMLLQEVAQAV